MRLMGILLLSFVPVFLGMVNHSEIMYQGREKAAMIRFFQFIRFRIETFTHPQKKIFSDFSDSILEKNGFLINLRKEVEEDPILALYRTVKNTEMKGFSRGEWESVLEFSQNFGMQSKEAQINDLEKLLFLLQSQEEKAGPSRITRANLIRTAGLCAGIGILIIFL